MKYLHSACLITMMQFVRLHGAFAWGIEAHAPEK